MAAPPSTTALREASRHSFAAFSQFLGEEAALEETRTLRASLATLSAHIEQVTQARRTRQEPAAIARQVATLSRQARQHQLLLTGMGSAWHALYEFGAYQRALRELRQALERWQQALAQRDAAEPEQFGEFERLAWRTLGEALLVLDIYEQQSGGGAPAPLLPARAPAPARTPLLARLRRWLAERGL